ncbi:MAG: TPM domain-containing protein, partial [Eubacteriales bacterium]
MNKIIKKMLALPVLALILTITVLPAFAIKLPDAPELVYVADYANVLSQTTIDHIVEKNDYLNAQCGAQIVIMTTAGLGGEDIEAYANSVFNGWGIGDSEKNNGVLLLMSIGDEDYWCLQGKGLEKTLSSGVIGVMLDNYLEPYFAKADYDGGASVMFDALYEKVASIYGVGEQTGGASGGTSASGSSGASQESDYSEWYDDAQYYGGRAWSVFNGLGGIVKLIIGIIVIAVVYNLMRSIFRGLFGRGTGDAASWCLFCPCSPC